ncbi:tumor necrosis factor ligand superfamily member 9 [Dendropsophus ebraccatus]|uniref:tumor necrosis factor ligand superfamily member 9 n=1 Tax=Dendropsophus ebraccatus TaxID=150705 RepID=UPI0038315633
MSPPPVRSEDPENPKSSTPRCRSLDYCLVISMVLLTLVVGSLCTLYVFWEKPSFGSIVSEQIHSYEQERNVQLVVDNPALINGTLEWSKNGVENTFVGQYFKHDKQELVVQESGYYFIFSQITLKCIHPSRCQEEGAVSLTVLKNVIKEKILNLNVHINHSNMKGQPSSFSGIGRYLTEGDRIGAELQTSHKISQWQFERERTVLGLLWISRIPPLEFPE